MKLFFTISYATEYGKRLALKVLNGKDSKIYDFRYSDNKNWKAEIEFSSKNIEYKYLVLNDAGQIVDEEICTHKLNFSDNFSDFVIYFHTLYFSSLD